MDINTNQAVGATESEFSSKKIGLIVTLNPNLAGYYEDIMRGSRSLWNYCLPKEPYIGD